MARKIYTKQAVACHCMNLRCTSLATSISQSYNEFLAPSGLTIRQYSLIKQDMDTVAASLSEIRTFVCYYQQRAYTHIDKTYNQLTNFF